jgi:hypothetical protein
LNRRNAFFIPYRTEQVRKALLHFQIFLGRLSPADRGALGYFSKLGFE